MTIDKIFECNVREEARERDGFRKKNLYRRTIYFRDPESLALYVKTQENEFLMNGYRLRNPQGDLTGRGQYFVELETRKEGPFEDAYATIRTQPISLKESDLTERHGITLYNGSPIYDEKSIDQLLAEPLRMAEG